MMRLIIGALILLTAFLSYKISSSEFFLIALIFLALLFLVLIGIIRSFRRINFKYAKIPLLVICISLAGILVSLLRPYNEPLKISADAGENLEYAFKTDQEDRRQLRSYADFFSELKDRDRRRLQQVKEILSGNKELKSLDKFHAAFVLHHSQQSEDYKLAAGLAAAAAKDPALKDVYEVQWLKKAAYDRWMVSIGEPEKYNTQNKLDIDIN